MSKTYSTVAKGENVPDSKPGTSFTLNIEAGDFRDGEVIALMGENGCGKTTFMELLAGNTKDQRGKVRDLGADGVGGPELPLDDDCYEQKELDTVGTVSAASGLAIARPVASLLATRPPYNSILLK